MPDIHEFQINMNGDAQDTFKKEYKRVMEAARELENALSELSTIHGRNYQHLEPLNAQEKLNKAARDRNKYFQDARAIKFWAEVALIRVHNQTKG